ncbi:MAG: L-threonylcarbamoyladenylate synthase [Micropruina sp.]|uniref:L-threonylcarbamoyladenylate synthase n=1 Tax=Micropruina sp. TaxID=2737536 RepID=UPI0039E497A7
MTDPQAPQRFDCATQADQALAAAEDAIAAGACIVLPTDTVYGIGANAFDAAAVQGLLDAKQRGRDMPPPVLIAEPSMLRSLATGLTADGLALAKAFWPGALTVVVTAHPDLRLDLGDRGDTIAVRVPDHAFTRALLRHTGPLAVSSANVSGRPAAETIDEAVEQLGESVAVYLDAGPAAGPVPSTIVDLTGEPRILREGQLTREQLTQAVPGLFGDDA